MTKERPHEAREVYGHDQNPWRQADSQTPIEPSFPAGATEVGDQIVCRHEVRPLPGLNPLRRAHRTAVKWA
jgi:hypothetical protein